VYPNGYRYAILNTRASGHGMRGLTWDYADQYLSARWSPENLDKFYYKMGTDTTSSTFPL
jgi:hypothetical protein